MKTSSLNKWLLYSLLLYGFNEALAQDATININASQDKRAVSPYIFGSNTSFDRPAAFYQDAGLRFARMNGRGINGVARVFT
jgi:hypothetical protein